MFLQFLENVNFLFTYSRADDAKHILSSATVMTFFAEGKIQESLPGAVDLPGSSIKQRLL